MSTPTKVEKCGDCDHYLESMGSCSLILMRLPKWVVPPLIMGCAPTLKEGGGDGEKAKPKRKKKKGKQKKNEGQTEENA